MSKLKLLKKFMKTFVGNGFHLIIRENGHSFLVHTIEIIQKIDARCPVKEIPVGDYFLRLLATDENNREASIFCNWSEQLFKNLLDRHVQAKEAGSNRIFMLKESSNGPNYWLLTRDGGPVDSLSETLKGPQPRTYIS